MGVTPILELYGYLPLNGVGFLAVLNYGLYQLIVDMGMLNTVKI